MTLKTCEKIPYASKRQAKKARWQIERNVGWRMTPYQCPHCKRWHLATKTNSKLRAPRILPKPNRREAVWNEDELD